MKIVEKDPNRGVIVPAWWLAELMAELRRLREATR